MSWSYFRSKQRINRHKPRRSWRNRGAGAFGRRRPLFEELEQRHMLAVITVTNVDDGALGALAGNGISLREAIEAANTDTSVDGSTAGSGADIIEFAPGLSGQTINLADRLDITESVNINGLGAANLAIDGADTYQIFYITDTVGDATISGLTLSNGEVFGFGGAIFADNTGLLTVADSVITGCAALIGGGIFSYGDVTLTNTIVGGTVALATHNYAVGYGGGIYAHGNITLRNSTVTGNLAGIRGGGIAGLGTVSVLDNSVIGGTAAGAGNKADDIGGGIYADTVILQNSRITGNEAVSGDGGGIYARGNVTIKYSSVSGNTAGNYGGGIYSRGNVIVEKSTIGGIAASDGNSAVDNGGGIHAQRDVTLIQSTVSGNEATGGGAVGGGIHSNRNVTLRNSTVSANMAEDHGGGIYADKLTVLNSTISGNFADVGGGGTGTGGGAFVITRFRMTNSIVVGNTDNGMFPDLRIPAGASTVRFSLIGDNTGLPPAAAEPQFTVTGPMMQNDFGNFIGMPGTPNEILATAPAGQKSAFGSGAGAGVLANNMGPTPTIALTTDSITIDTARNSLAVNAAAGDQRGLPFVRIFGGRVDMGAFEFQTVVPNAAPVVANVIPDQTAVVGSAFIFTFAANTFTDADLDPLTYTATLAGGGALPLWLSFTQGTNGRTFVGVPAAGDIGAINIQVTASDGKGGFVSDTFTLTVVAAELPFSEFFNNPAIDPRLIEKAASFMRTIAGPLEGAGSFLATRPTVGSRPLATVDFASPATAPMITNVKVNVATEVGNGSSLWSNAAIAFDFQDTNNYKFAGVFEIIDKLIIGQVVNGQVQYLKQVVFPAAPNTSIPLDLTINRTTRQVTLTSGATSVTHTFAALGNGTVGLGTINANARFDQLQIS
jgi:predicted outer membrane repeat protein